jgi:peptide/nickel transport system permease protein
LTEIPSLSQSPDLMVRTKPNHSAKSRRFGLTRQLLQEPKSVIGLIILAFFLIVMIFAPWLATHDPVQPLGVPWQPPSHEFWFGTTDQGQDVYSQWVWGTRTSMLSGLGVGVIATLISVIIGVYSGYKGGKIDAVLNWLTNVMLVLPSYPLILVVASYIPNASSWAIMLVLGLTSWPAAARMKRSQALTFKTRDFVLAAKLTGVSDLRIMTTEILPNMLSLVFNTFIGMMNWGIFGEAFLRFLGIGSTSTASWGNMLNWAQNGQALLNGGWWWFIPPGLSMTLVILALTLINYGVDTVSNPKLARPPKLPRDIRKALRQLSQGGV